MSGTPEAFLDRVASLVESERAFRQFDRLLQLSVPTTDPIWHAKLYEALARHLLSAFRLPASAGAAFWEWAPLFRLGREIDPHYFAPRDIAVRLAECPPLTHETREALVEILSRYFAWRRQGLLLPAGAPLLDAAETLRWAALFPPNQAGAALDVVRAVGLHPLGSAGAWRAWRRFGVGEFAQEFTLAALREWVEACGRGAGASTAGAHRREFALAAFACEWASHDIAGFCGNIPDCSRCPLRKDCAWGSNSQPEPRSGAEAIALLRREGGASLSSDRLWQALFDLSGEATARLRRSLESAPLRTLAGKSLPELEQWIREWATNRGGDGTGTLGAERVQALFELARRFAEERLLPGVTFRGAKDVFKHFRMRLRDAKQEHFFLVLLDSRRRFLGEVAVSQGTMDRALVHPRDVFGAAVRERAGAVIIVHNHPSGDPYPSTEDINVTKRLVEAGLLVGIPLLDHIVVGEERYFSLSEQGLMPT